MLFVTEDALRSARSDRSYPRCEVFSALCAASEQHLRVPPETLLALPPRHNLFVWNNAILELGLAFALTEDERFLAHLLDLVRSLSCDGWKRARFDEHISVPFVLAALAAFYDLQGGLLNDGDAHALISTMAAMAEHVWDSISTRVWGSLGRTVWNHNVVGYTAIAIAGLILPDHPLADEWVHTGLDRTRRFVEEGVTPAGMTWEGLNYCGLVFKHLGMVMLAVKNLGWQDRYIAPGSELEERLSRIPEWYAHSVFPRGGYLQNYNDSHWDPHSALWGFLLSFAEHRPELCAAVWERLVGRHGLATFGADPRRSSLTEAMLFFPRVDVDLTPLEELDDVYFCPDVGFLAARDRGGERATVFTFNAGPFLGGVHDQADNNSFTLIARGEPVVLDSGSANRASEDSPSSSLGHNVVLIDGVGQHVAGQGHGVTGAILGVSHDELVVAVSGDATPSYSLGGHNVVLWSYRHAVFVKRPVPYVVTFDDICKDEARHVFEYLLHVPRGKRCDTHGSQTGVTISSPLGDGAGRIVFLAPEATRARVSEFHSSSRPFQVHQLWRFATDAINPYFVVLFCAAASPVPLRHTVQVCRRESRTTVTIDWPQSTDTIDFPMATSREIGNERPALPVFTRSRRPDEPSD